MLVFIDDGSTNIKLQWQESDGTIKQHISPNSFKREWAVSFGDKKVFNYTLNGEQYSFDPISPDAVVTTNIAWQYSDVNVVAPRLTDQWSAGKRSGYCLHTSSDRVLRQE